MFDLLVQFPGRWPAGRTTLPGRAGDCRVLRRTPTCSPDVCSLLGPGYSLVYRNIHTLVIGKAFSAVDLGFYSRGRDLAVRPGMLISTILNRVAFPVFSQVQDGRARLVRGIRKALAILAFVSFPALIGLAAVARPLVIVLLTECWLPAVPIIQLLCVSGAMYPLHAIHLNVLKSLGRSDLFLRLEFIKKGMAITNIVVMLPFGLLPLIAGQAVLALLGYLLNSHYTRVLLVAQRHYLRFTL